jgi:hypothetical protein
MARTITHRRTMTMPDVRQQWSEEYIQCRRKLVSALSEMTFLVGIHTPAGQQFSEKTDAYCQELDFIHWHLASQDLVTQARQTKWGPGPSRPGGL